MAEREINKLGTFAAAPFACPHCGGGIVLDRIDATTTEVGVLRIEDVGPRWRGHGDPPTFVIDNATVERADAALARIEDELGG